MKRSREPTSSHLDSSIKQTSNGTVFYDCPYKGCSIRAHNQHNLDKHIEACKHKKLLEKMTTK